MIADIFATLVAEKHGWTYQRLLDKGSRAYYKQLPFDWKLPVGRFQYHNYDMIIQEGGLVVIRVLSADVTHFITYYGICGIDANSLIIYK